MNNYYAGVSIYFIDWNLEMNRSREDIFSLMELFNREIDNLEKEYEKLPNDNLDVINVFRKYEPALVEWKTGANIYAVTLIHINEELMEDIQTLFRENAGYKGKKRTHLLLRGHIKFSKVEQIIFERYGIEWESILAGSARN